MNKPTYLDLIREFYMNTRLGNNGIISTVRNTVIKVNPQTLFEKFKIPVVEESIEVPFRKESLTIILDNETLLLKKIILAETLLLK